MRIEHVAGVDVDLDEHFSATECEAVGVNPATVYYAGRLIADYTKAGGTSIVEAAEVVQAAMANAGGRLDDELLDYVFLRCVGRRLPPLGQLSLL